MPNSYFQFKQFTIQQEKCAMKVGTDGVLLGTWTEVDDIREGKVIDIGTGTGLIALMLAQKNNRLQIDAVEIDEDAAQQARENVMASPWAKRIVIYQQSFLDFYIEKNSKGIKFDLIVCNPPYFKQSVLQKEKARNQARNAHYLPLHILLQGVQLLLSDKGKFSIILPYEQQEECLTLSEHFQLCLQRSCTVFPTPHKAAKRILMEFRKNIKTPVINEELIIETGKRHEYSKKYLRLTQDFYLD